MTNGWIDIKNTDMMLIMGGNPAECHPCGFKWPIEAKLQRNAKLIVVDPRFTRTAANADLFLQIRPGSDIAFLGGMINYALAHGTIAHEYLVNYTNAAFIVKDGFKLPEDGLYSGFDSESHVYDKSTWNYEQGGNLTRPGSAAGAPAATLAPPPPPPPISGPGRSGNALPVDTHAMTGLGYAAQGPAGAKSGSGGATSAHHPPTPAILPPNVAYDMTLQHPRCVYQLLARQYSRYTPEIVERITGIPKDQFLKAAELFTSIRKGGDMKKAATIIYAVGWTQHSSGTQIIRSSTLASNADRPASPRGPATAPAALFRGDNAPSHPGSPPPPIRSGRHRSPAEWRTQSRCAGHPCGAPARPAVGRHHSG
jgi:formate dehydrogenase major subunit